MKIRTTLAMLALLAGTAPAALAADVKTESGTSADTKANTGAGGGSVGIESRTEAGGNATVETPSLPTGKPDGSGSAAGSATGNATGSLEGAIKELDSPLVGARVVSTDNEVMGEVESVIDRGGEKVAVIAFGGFLGLGESEVTVPAADLRLVGEGMARLNMTSEQVKNLPAHKG